MRKTLAVTVLGSLAVSASLMGVEVKPMQVEAVKTTEKAEVENILSEIDYEVGYIEELGQEEKDGITRDVFMVQERDSDGFYHTSSITRYGTGYILDKDYAIGDFVMVRYLNDEIYSERKLYGSEKEYYMNEYKSNVYKYTDENFLKGAKQL